MSITEVEQQQLLIGGDWANAGSGDTFERADPWTGEVASRAAAAGRGEARAAAGPAAAAVSARAAPAAPSPGGPAPPPSARRALLQDAAALMKERAPDIANVVTAETGGT